MDLECEGWAKILEIFPEMDFAAELEEQPELGKYLKSAINTKSVAIDRPSELPDRPKLDDDFSKFIVLNGLPKCDAKKSEKLNALLVKLFGKKNFILADDAIEHHWDDAEPPMTTGQAFVQLKNDEQAKVAAALFNGHALDKKHTFSSCTFPDFSKIMSYEDKSSAASKTDYLELRAQVLETKKNDYAFQVGKQVQVASLEGQNKALFDQDPNDDDVRKFGPFQTDKAFSWSPKGTYLIVIKSDKVEFLGGSQMKSIMTINEPKVEQVIFSPCETYLMVYSPKNDNPYAVWNFMTLEKIREFDQARNENAQTYQWSFNGKFIAKIKNEYIPIEYSEEDTKKQEEEREAFITKREAGDENAEEPVFPTETIKSFIAVYELPSMKMIEDGDGARTSIYVEGL